MGLADTADLAILLQLKGNAAAGLRDVDHALGGVHARTATVSGGISKMSAGLGVAAARSAMLSVGLVAAVGGVALNATKAAASYQAAMELIQTQAGASAAEVTSMSKAILALAPQVGQGPEALAAGLYHIESAGLRGAKALDVLKAAAMGAKVGNADLESVTNALIAANQSGVGGVTSMTGAMGTLNGIVGAGNMRMQDLTDAFGTGILSTAKTFGVNITSVGAALADMTDQGIPAIDAATRLRMTLSLMGAPTAKAATGMKSIGLGTLDMAKAMRGPDGILGAVELLAGHMVKAGMIDASGNPNTKGAALLSSMFGGGRSSSAIMTLIGNLDLFRAKQDAVVAGAGAFGDAWAANQQTVDTKAAMVRASIDSLRIQLGQQLLPVAANVLDALAQGLADPAVTKGIEDFGQALASMFTPANLSSAERFVTGVIPQIGNFATSILPPLISGLRIAGQVTSTVVGMFMSLPGPLQAAIIGGLAVNKLSGGLLGSGLKEVISAVAGGATGGGAGGALGGILGVQKVFVVNMSPGGMGGGGLPGAAAGAGGAAGAGEGAATVAAGGTLAGIATLGAGIVGILAAYALPLVIASELNRSGATQSGVTGPNIAGTNTPIVQLSPQQLDQVSGGSAAVRAAILANTTLTNPATPSRDTDKLQNSAVGAGRDTDKLGDPKAAKATAEWAAKVIAASKRDAATAAAAQQVATNVFRAGERATTAGAAHMVSAQRGATIAARAGEQAIKTIPAAVRAIRAPNFIANVTVQSTVSVAGLVNQTTVYRRYAGKIAAMGV